MLKLHTLIRKPADGDGGDNGGAPKESAAPKDQTETPEAGSNLDEFGYEKTPASGEPPADQEKKADDKKAAPEVGKLSDIKEPATGYGKDPLKADDPPADPPAEEKKVELGFELDVKDLDEKEALKIKEFALTHKLPKEAAQALIDSKKAEIANSIAARSQAEKDEVKRVNNIKAGWDRELRDHPTFGKENFEQSVFRAEKVYAEHMKETKLHLTKVGGMLPPYVMKDLNNLYDQLYSTQKLVEGDVPGSDVPKKEEKNDPLEFYNT